MTSLPYPAAPATHEVPGRARCWRRERRSRTLTGTLAAAAALLAPASAGAVYHGTVVAPADAPWLATLSSHGAVHCGGVLVAPTRVLTAAHCVQGAEPARLRLTLRGQPGGQAVPVASVRLPVDYAELPSPVHPGDPNASATVSDVAVLDLGRTVRDVAPLAVAPTPPGPGEPVTLIGHGRTGVTQAGGQAPSPPVARSAGQTVVGPAACAASYGRLLRPALHLCTIDRTATHAQACAGDSGSPLLVVRDGVPQLVAVDTWGGETHGRGCGEGLPDVSERILPHLALVAGAAGGPAAPWSARRTRVDRRHGRLTCYLGDWHPATARLQVSWFIPGKLPTGLLQPGSRSLSPGPDRPLPGVHARSIRARSTPLGCVVRARTAGGWAAERSYNAR